MFNTLIVSRPQTKGAWHRELAGTTCSFVIHAMVVYAAAMATAFDGAATSDGPREAAIVYFESPTQTLPEPVAPTVARVFRTLVAPATIPTSIPPIDLHQVFDLGMYSGIGTEVGPLQGVEAPMHLTEVFLVAAVDEPPAPISFPPPEYPRMLLEARIEGSVVLEAVIDTLGNPEPGSIKVVSSTNHGFDAVGREALRRALFRPGRVQGQRVRVLVRQPLRFQLPVQVRD